MKRKMIALILTVGAGILFSGSTKNVMAESNTQMPTGFNLTGCEYESGDRGFYIFKSESVGLYGLVDANGNIALPAVYDEMTFLTSRDDVAVEVQIEGKWGVYDGNGNVILSPEYEMIKAGKSKYLVQKDDKQSLVDADGTLIKDLANEYTDIDGDYFLVRQTFSEYKLFDIDENELSETGVFFENDSKQANTEMIIDFDQESSSYKVINENGETVFWQENENGEAGYGYKAEFLSSDTYLSLQKFDLKSLGEKNAYSLYDMKKRIKNEEEYSKMYEFNKNEICGVKEDGIDIYDEAGDVRSITLEAGYSDVIWDKESPILVVKYGETYRLYNSDGSRITEDRYIDYDFWGGKLIVENLNGEYGIINEYGKMDVPFGEITGEGEEYNGEEIESIYADDDYLYILTEPYEDTMNLYIV